MTHWENSWAHLVWWAHGKSGIVFLHLESARTVKSIGAGNWATGNRYINHMTNTCFLLSHVSVCHRFLEWKRHSFPEDRLWSNETLCARANGRRLAIPLIPQLIVTAHKRAKCNLFCESRRRDYTAFPCNHPPPPGADRGPDLWWHDGRTKHDPCHDQDPAFPWTGLTCRER